MQNNYFVQERQIKIVQGPGREPTSGQIFLRFAGPDGYVFSYGYGLKDIDPRHRPRQFTPEISRSANGGANAPMSLNCGRRRVGEPSYAPESKMIELKDLSYVRLGASSLDDAGNFRDQMSRPAGRRAIGESTLSPIG